MKFRGNGWHLHIIHPQNMLPMLAKHISFLCQFLFKVNSLLSYKNKQKYGGKMSYKCSIIYPSPSLQQKACFNADDGSGPELAPLSHLWPFLSLRRSMSMPRKSGEQGAHNLLYSRAILVSFTVLILMQNFDYFKLKQSSVVEHLPSMTRGLGLIFSAMPQNSFNDSPTLTPESKVLKSNTPH